jgi:hypothetical protein
MSSSIARCAAAAGALLLAFGWPAARPAAQNARPLPAGAPAALPDVVGFRPGTPLQDAYKQLQAYGIRGAVRIGQIALPELGDKLLSHTLQLSEAGPTSPEVLQLDITLPPGRQVVWKASRVLQGTADKPMALASVREALREKYGQEFALSPASTSYYWFFDAQGRRAAETGALAYKNCVAPFGVDTGPSIANNVDQLQVNPYDDPRFTAMPAQQVPCRALVIVVAHLSPIGGDLIGGLRVSVTDVGLAAQGRQATYDAIAAAQSKQQKDELNEAQQRKPTL